MISARISARHQPPIAPALPPKGSSHRTANAHEPKGDAAHGRHIVPHRVLEDTKCGERDQAAQGLFRRATRPARQRTTYPSHQAQRLNGIDSRMYAQPAMAHDIWPKRTLKPALWNRLEGNSAFSAIHTKRSENSDI